MASGVYLKALQVLAGFSAFVKVRFTPTFLCKIVNLQPIESSWSSFSPKSFHASHKILQAQFVFSAWRL